MKRQIYDLTDDEFAMFANKVGTVFNQKKLPHYIGGGTAVQAYILGMLCQRHSDNVEGLVHNHQVRIQDYIRSTDDIDIALKLEGNDEEKIRSITGILPELAFSDINPSQNNIVEFKLSRLGASRPLFRVYVDDRGTDEEVIAMNLFRGQKDSLRGLDISFYDYFIEQSRDLTVPYQKGYDVKLRAPRLEHLLAMKVANSRAKDLMDNKNILDFCRLLNIKVDFSELERILPATCSDNYLNFLKTNYPDRLPTYEAKRTLLA